MDYEKADGRCDTKPDKDDPAFRSHQEWKKGRPKRSATALPKGVSTLIEFEDPGFWRCDLALRRERLAKLAGAR
jgi:hypothetical protein